jgi:hypothetical protein
MRESSQLIRIEKHRVQNAITCLTFCDEAVPPAGGEEVDACRPLVFVVHGLMSRKERHIELCLALARAGFLACTLDAHHHGERATPEASSRLSGALGLEFFGAFAEAVIGTAADLPILGDYFGAPRYGVIGHSMGGYVALRAGATDERVRVVVSIAGNPDWLLLPDNAAAYLPPAIADLVRSESPLGQADRFWPRPLLMLHGTADTTVPIQGHRNLLAAVRPRYAPDPARLDFVEYPGVGHEWLPDMAERAVAWMTRYLPAEVA